ncbi:hypothetical protein [Schaedlerella sp.]
MKKKSKKILFTLTMAVLMFTISAVPVFASGDVAGGTMSSFSTN